MPANIAAIYGRTVKYMPRTVHKINRSRSVHRVVVVGCGGTGSAVIGGLPFLHQALLAAGYPGLHVIVADGDKVTATNCVRQPFSESEIGLYKSVVLVNRLNLFWGLNWHASTEYVTAKTQGKADIIISCVDTRAARLEITKSPLFKECVYWLDLGNTADGGQFVLGQPKNDRNRKTPGGFPQLPNCFLKSSRLFSTAQMTSQLAAQLRPLSGRSRSSIKRSHIRLSRCWPDYFVTASSRITAGL
jgi:PRTRC genetic system ThiF family protein